MSHGNSSLGDFLLHSYFNLHVGEGLIHCVIHLSELCLAFSVHHVDSVLDLVARPGQQFFVILSCFMGDLPHLLILFQIESPHLLQIVLAARRDFLICQHLLDTTFVSHEKLVLAYVYAVVRGKFKRRAVKREWFL